VRQLGDFLRDATRISRCSDGRDLRVCGIRQALKRMPSRGSLVTHRLLSKFYDNVESLPDYLKRILPDHAEARIEQAFNAPSTTSSGLAASLERLQRSQVGSRSCSLFEEQTWSDWDIPSTQEAFSGGSLSEVNMQMRCVIDILLILNLPAPANPTSSNANSSS
jgi:hypothetical protein